MPLIAASGDIQIWFDDRGSDLCVITFAHMDFAQPGREYWAKELLAKLGYSAVGVVALTNNWYPEDDVREALRLSGMPWRRIHRRISYGHSMGGYGALKYGAAFGAQTTISLCAQFRGATPTVPPGPDDMPSNTYLLFDPAFASDKRDAETAKSAQPLATMVPMWHMGHDVAVAFNSSIFTEAVGAAVDHRRDDFISLMGRARRISQRRAFGLAKACLEHGHLTVADGIIAKQTFAPYWQDRWEKLRQGLHTSRHDRMRANLH